MSGEILYEQTIISQGAYLSPEMILLERLNHLIEAHFKEQKNPEFYADELNYSARSLNAVTKLLRGKTVFRMILDRITIEGKLLLSDSWFSVKQIAYELGFEDPAYFCRFFKKMTGVTALEYRREVWRLHLITCST